MFKLTRYPIAFSLIIGLILVASLSLVASFYTLWMTSVLSGDATAINISGSLRMQSYRIAYAIQSETSPATTNRLLEEFESRLTSLELKGHISYKQREIKTVFSNIEQHFRDMKKYAQTEPGQYVSEVELFVENIDHLVELLQYWSEDKVSKLRRQQIIISLITLIAASLFATLIFYRLISPLQTLMKAVLEIRRGNRSARADYGRSDEFGELSTTFNLMAQEISDVHLSLESKITEQTKELSRNNHALEFLFNLSQFLSTDNPDIEEIRKEVAKDLSDICKAKKIYWTQEDVFNDDNTYVVKCTSDRCHLVCEIDTALEPWQQRIFNTVGDLFDNAINRMGIHKNENRIALLNERSSIARELHDSLAQSLSYLKIQVVRWLKLRERGADQETLDSIIQELRDGLNSTYRKLRELLVTFRSHSDEPGLIPSVKAAADEINRISQNTKIHLYIDENWPEDLSPSQEIHCLHVIREALTNVIKHAQAENAVVSLKQKDTHLEIRINDDGIGFEKDPEKPMHYGLKIMSERAQRIGGKIEYQKLNYGGSGVRLTFAPEIKPEKEEEL